MPDLLKLTHTLCLILQGKCIGHGDYYHLLKSKDVVEIMGSSALINAVDMTVTENVTDEGLTVLEWQQSAKKVLIKCDRQKAHYKCGTPVKIFIAADDIALALQKVDNVTIQNQINGVIVDVIQNNSITFCIVDVGFQLVVEITAQSQKRMNLRSGLPVWCLFKSVAIHACGISGDAGN